MPLDHDTRCDSQDSKLHEMELRVAVLAESLKPLSSDLDMVVERTQAAVREYTAQGLLLLAAAKDIEATRKDILMIREDVASIRKTLSEKVTPLDQFLTVRNQLWGGIGVIVAGFLSALVWLVLRGGGKA